jgi:hypothetical protein
MIYFLTPRQSGVRQEPGRFGRGEDLSYPYQACAGKSGPARDYFSALDSPLKQVESSADGEVPRFSAPKLMGTLVTL